MPSAGARLPARRSGWHIPTGRKAWRGDGDWLWRRKCGPNLASGERSTPHQHKPDQVPTVRKSLTVATRYPLPFCPRFPSRRLMPRQIPPGRAFSCKPRTLAPNLAEFTLSPFAALRAVRSGKANGLSVTCTSASGSLF